MDPAIGRLAVNAGACRTPGGAVPATGFVQCVPDNAAFAALISQYGFAFTPTAMHSARTTGFGGFQFSLEGVFTKIDQGKSYWVLGTQGSRRSTDAAASNVGTPVSVLQLYNAKVTKSFGFGLELTGVAGFLAASSLINAGVDIRMSLLEGLRLGFGGALPDVAVGAGVRTVMGTPEFHLTVVSVDAQISKPLAIADSSVLTPWLGYQYAWIFGDSGVVDFTPQTDPLDYCNFTGDAVPGTPPTGESSDFPPPYNGAPVCKDSPDGVPGSTADFNNNQVFDSARISRQRLLFGFNYRYEVVSIGVQFAVDMLDPHEAQPVDSGEAAVLVDEGRQFSFMIDGGARF